MKLTFLGTGSAGAKNIPETELPDNQRRCSALLLDRNALVDLPLQAFDFSAKLGVDLSSLTDIFLTHTHRDHYVKAVLLQFAAASCSKLNLWCHSGAVGRLDLSEEEAQSINLCPIDAGQQWETAGMKITALAANHLVVDSKEQPLHYIFEKGGKKLFYGCDGGWLRTETWKHIRDQAVFDAMILDSTVEDYPGDFRIGGHNTIPMLRLLLAAFRENGVLSENSLAIASHMRMPHSADWTAQMRELGMLAAYDGLTLEL